MSVTYVCMFRTCSVTSSSTLREWHLCSPCVTCFCAMRMPAAAMERMTPSSRPRSAWTSAGEISAPCLWRGGWGMTIYPDASNLKHTITAHRCLVILLHSLMEGNFNSLWIQIKKLLLRLRFTAPCWARDIGKSSLCMIKCINF